MKENDLKTDDIAAELHLNCACERCEANEANEPHACPFKSEINNDDTECTCCNECTHECAMDI